MFKVLFLMFIGICSVSANWRNPPGVIGADGHVGKLCNPGLPGAVGEEGDSGLPGRPGAKGIKGRAGSSFARPPPGELCRCPPGPDGERGEIGDPGWPGERGPQGAPGNFGEKGEQGERGRVGRPGVPAPPLPRYPPTVADTMFLPVMLRGKVPRTVCAHIRKQAYVPGVPHDWLGWYETGKSSYLTFNKWLYFSSRFQCPCTVPIPPGPTPSSAELLRLL
ncbi:collagen alpha-2(I) chain-like [Dendronephthya gigantea]|uniref:collagen alpha-2(I) chain-like n=1 Tax=Dendronephthya gigantea TaxID=151771 RepID=UPI001069B661|nr:collagen alpha-2(I) chain-like [Dendronephthya gigantea]